MISSLVIGTISVLFFVIVSFIAIRILWTLKKDDDIVCSPLCDCGLATTDCLFDLEHHVI